MHGRAKAKAHAQPVDGGNMALWIISLGIVIGTLMALSI